MRHFWTLYLTTALVSTAGVYCLAPLARPFLVNSAAPREPSAEAEAPEEAGSEFPALEEPAPLTRSLEEARPSGVGAAEEPVRSPAMLGIHLVARGDLAPSWGLTCRPSACFMMDGLPTVCLEAGKKIDYRSTQYSSRGAMVEFMVDSPVGIPTTPYLTSQTNLYLFTGSYAGLTAGQIEELKDCYALRETAAASERRPAARPPKGVLLVQRGDVAPAWGVVRQQASCYTADGRRDGLVEAGELIDYERAVSSSKGVLTDCLICSQAGRSPARALISQKDLHLFTGSYRDLSAAQVKDLRTYYELAGKKAARKKQLLQASAAQNPHFPAYQSSYQALMAHIEKSKAAVVHRDHAVDAEKVQAQEQLYELRTEERRLRIIYEEAEKQFKDWKKAHASELRLPDDDPDMAQWSKGQGRLAPGLAGLAF